jgi:small subunit ribosomal protein S19
MNTCHKKLLNLDLLSKAVFLKNNFYFKMEDRNIFVKKSWIGLKVAVYNGKCYIPIQIKENMVGKMLGSLIFTKKILLKAKKKFRK